MILLYKYDSCINYNVYDFHNKIYVSKNTEPMLPKKFS